MRNEVKSSQRAPLTRSFRLVTANLPASLGVSATGCPEGYPHCTVQRVAAGSFRLDLNTAYGRVPQVLIIPLHASASLKPILTTRSASSITWLVKNDAGTATDPTEMDVFICGSEVADQI